MKAIGIGIFNAAQAARTVSTTLHLNLNRPRRQVSWSTRAKRTGVRIMATHNGHGRLAVLVGLPVLVELRKPRAASAKRGKAWDQWCDWLGVGAAG